MLDKGQSNNKYKYEPDSTKDDRLDGTDCMIAVSSGVLTALLDILWAKDFSLENAQSWGREKAEQFVIRVAKSRDYRGNDIKSAIKKLEVVSPLPSDSLTTDFGGGRQHHLRDFGHHPTVVGLIFSLLTQFTGYGFGTDTNGSFQWVKVKDPGVLGCNPLEKIYNGTVIWTFHLISDLAGSSSGSGYGTGIPGPLLSFFKEISSIPAVRTVFGKDDNENYLFSINISKLFNGTLLATRDADGKIIETHPFDLRTEMGIVYEISKQTWPVVINECIVRALYAVRRFCMEIKTNDVQDLTDLQRIDDKAFLPLRSKVLDHMTMLSAVTFSVIDISAAGLNAAIKNKDNPEGFARDFLRSINYLGIGRSVLSASREVMHGLENLHGEYLSISQKQAKCFTGDNQLLQGMDSAVTSLSDIGAAVGAIAGMSAPMGFVTAAINVFRSINTAVGEANMAQRDRILVERECSVSIASLRQNRVLMEQSVSDCMMLNSHVFSKAFDQIDAAISANDSDEFIAGNVTIQKYLGGNVEFTDQMGFDTLMASDEDFRL